LIVANFANDPMGPVLYGQRWFLKAVWTPDAYSK
jgi:hypothetical protein